MSAFDRQRVTWALLKYRPATPAMLLDMLMMDRRKDKLRVYAGNLQWSILAALYGLGGSKLKTPSYGEYAAMLDGEAETGHTERDVDKVRRAVDAMIEAYLPEKANA